MANNSELMHTVTSDNPKREYIDALDIFLAQAAPFKKNDLKNLDPVKIYPENVLAGINLKQLYNNNGGKVKLFRTKNRRYFIKRPQIRQFIESVK